MPVVWLALAPAATCLQTPPAIPAEAPSPGSSGASSCCRGTAGTGGPAAQHPPEHAGRPHAAAWPSLCSTDVSSPAAQPLAPLHAASALQPLRTPQPCPPSRLVPLPLLSPLPLLCSIPITLLAPSPPHPQVTETPAALGDPGGPRRPWWPLETPVVLTPQRSPTARGRQSCPISLRGGGLLC